MYYIFISVKESGCVKLCQFVCYSLFQCLLAIWETYRCVSVLLKTSSRKILQDSGVSLCFFFTFSEWNTLGNAWAVCRWSNPTRPVSSSQQMKPLQATSLPSWRETEQITHDVKQLAREPKIIPIKTEYKCFDTLSLPFHESWGSALAHSQFSALSLFQVHALWLVKGEKF